MGNMKVAMYYCGFNDFIYSLLTRIQLDDEDIRFCNRYCKW